MRKKTVSYRDGVPRRPMDQIMAKLASIKTHPNLKKDHEIIIKNQFRNEGPPCILRFWKMYEISL